MKTSELTGFELDWAVAECEGRDFPAADAFSGIFNPSTDWAQGGLIIEREMIQIKENGYGYWFAKIGKGKFMRGPTPLIAAMRCYVASKMGDNINIPEELQ